MANELQEIFSMNRLPRKFFTENGWKCAISASKTRTVTFQIIVLARCRKSINSGISGTFHLDKNAWGLSIQGKSVSSPFWRRNPDSLAETGQRAFLFQFRLKTRQPSSAVMDAQAHYQQTNVLSAANGKERSVFAWNRKPWRRHGECFLQKETEWTPAELPRRQ